MSNDEDLIMVCCSDFSGQLRGKAFPATDWEERAKRGVGWVPTNMQITTFDTIADSASLRLGQVRGNGRSDSHRSL